MRAYVITSLAMACLCIAGCKKEEKPKSAADSSGNPLNAPADYIGALGKAQKSAQKTLGVNGMDQALKTFFAEEGRYPKDLEELKQHGVSIPAPPAGMKWEYDARTGEAKTVPQ